VISEAERLPEKQSLVRPGCGKRQVERAQAADERDHQQRKSAPVKYGGAQAHRGFELSARELYILRLDRHQETNFARVRDFYSIIAGGAIAQSEWHAACLSSSLTTAPMRVQDDPARSV
jgi:hypothetical protein